MIDLSDISILKNYIFLPSSLSPPLSFFPYKCVGMNMPRHMCVKVRELLGGRGVVLPLNFEVPVSDSGP